MANNADATMNDFVGSQVCQSCHQQQFTDWQQSHHAKAMQIADAGSVLGNFKQQRFGEGDNQVTFRQDQQAYSVELFKAGKKMVYPVPYTFGIYPLQQYLLALPDGRLQALNIAWDTRPANEGGQHWFALYPEVAGQDPKALSTFSPLHNWNSRCGSCHTTHLQKNYVQASNTYNSRWSEINVACEACHGPAAGHVDWVNDRNILLINKGFGKNLVNNSLWQRTPDQAVAHRADWPLQNVAGNKQHQQQIQSCAGCHSLRAEISTGKADADFHQNYQSNYITDEHYHADGQVKDEVFEYDAFLQSKMYQQGVVCSDCHNPHSGELKAEGNAVCTQCHAPEVFDTNKHHHHAGQSSGSQCVNCHMPEKTFMVIDKRHDHGFRIPRPELTASLGIPNTCSQCHNDKPISWMLQQVTQWKQKAPSANNYKGGDDDFYAATVMASAWQQDPAVLDDLARLALDQRLPAIMQASAVQALSAYPDSKSVNVAMQALKSPEPMLRVAALRALQFLPADQRSSLLPLLNDDRKAVRVELAPMLAAIPADKIPAEWNGGLVKLFDEYVATQQLSIDMPEPAAKLAGFYQLRGQPEKAEATWKHSLKLWPAYLPALFDLSAFYEAQGRAADAEKLLEQATKISAMNAAPVYAKALFYVRQKRLAEALPMFDKAVALDPRQVTYAYAYAAALFKQAKIKEAIKVLESCLQFNPGNKQIMQALVFYYHEINDAMMQKYYQEQLRDKSL